MDGAKEKKKVSIIRTGHFFEEEKKKTIDLTRGLQERTDKKQLQEVAQGEVRSLWC